MYIIDKNKDFYDHYSYIYGVDKKIVFDRRESVMISDEDLFNSLMFQRRLAVPKEGFLILEIAETQFLIRLFNMQTNNDRFISCEMELVRTFEDRVKRFDPIISIRGIELPYYWSWEKKDPIYLKKSASYSDIVRVESQRGITLPILAGTQLTSLLDGETIWKDIQNYISSLDNDRDCSTPMTDVDKAEIHGFDKKTSFRPNMK